VWKTRRSRTILRCCLFIAFLLALGYAQVRDTLRPEFAAQLEIVVEQTGTGEVVPARAYLFRSGQPFRLSPADSHLPLRVDLYYRERVWRQADRPTVLEVTARDLSHFLLLDGRAKFDLPAWDEYRLEVYRGFFFKPAVVEFSLRAAEQKRIVVRLDPIAPDRQASWIAADDHIHLMRDREDDELFLRWMRAEDLAVGNFLELQRQQHAAVQYGFGTGAEARLPGYSIRSGHESRSRFYGHVLFLGPRQMIRPLSIGTEYANSPEAYPFPALLFDQGRQQGAVVGFAHFYGSQPNSTLLMDLALGKIDFIELFQFGQLHTQPWYELLNGGFRAVGLAGSDFPANIGRFDAWPRAFPLLGPERALVKANAGESAYEAWAEGVRKGAVVVTNGPLLDFTVEGHGPGDVIRWDGESSNLAGTASAIFHRPITKLEIVANGQVVASRAGGEGETEVSLQFKAPIKESTWVAARVQAIHNEGEPEIWAHSNPVYFLKEGNPVYVEADRKALLDRWVKEAEYYRNPALVFADEGRRQALLNSVEETLRVLRAKPSAGN
jgi:hypothetical protein